MRGHVEQPSGAQRADITHAAAVLSAFDVNEHLLCANHTCALAIRHGHAQR